MEVAEILTWTKDDYEDNGLFSVGPPKKIKRFKATANGKDAYHIELGPDGNWALYRLWTRRFVADDGASRACSKDVETIKASAQEDLRKWRDLLDEMTASLEIL